MFQQPMAVGTPPVILQPEVPRWTGSMTDGAGGFRVNVCGPCGRRLPDDFDALTEPYECPTCGTLFEPDPPRRRRRKRRP